MGNWSYAKWVTRLENTSSADERYKLVDEIYEQGREDGYGDGFGAGKVCCGGMTCEAAERKL